MKVIKQIMLDEWRYWWRTKVATTVMLIGLLLTVAAIIVNSLEIEHKAHQREHLQHTAEARFVEQPDRHPHRMVHYGHYVFRTPSPLSIIEPGVDAFTGTSIFLEGHRQNSAMFSDQRQSSGLTRFSSLSPSFLIQVLAPLFIILIGYASVSREKEAGTLNIMITQGVNKWHLLLGKLLALTTSGLLLLLPLILASSLLGSEESGLITTSFILGYILYVLVWSALVVAISALVNKNSVSFTSLIVIWVALAILVPRIGSSTAASLVPSPGKLEADFAVLEEMRKLGDGHNAADPAFEKLKTNLLAKYQVDSIDKLPVNFRGVVAEYSEQKQAKVLNKFAEQRMSEELEQALIARQFGWLSPTVAIRSLSMMMAGTSLETHHRFLREAEALRIDFVQSLNRVHRDKLDYQTDVNRYKDEETAKKALVDASNWQVLADFEFAPESTANRLAQSMPYGLQLILWCVLVCLLLAVASRRMAQ